MQEFVATATPLAADPIPGNRRRACLLPENGQCSTACGRRLLMTSIGGRASDSLVYIAHIWGVGDSGLLQCKSAAAAEGD